MAFLPQPLARYIESVDNMAYKLTPYPNIYQGNHYNNGKPPTNSPKLEALGRRLEKGLEALGRNPFRKGEATTTTKRTSLYYNPRKKSLGT
jgi:hypothetical protein